MHDNTGCNNYTNKTFNTLLGGRFHHSQNIRNGLSLLKLVGIHKLYASIYMFKVLKLNSCEAIGNNMDLRRPHHQYLTRN